MLLCPYGQPSSLGALLFSQKACLRLTTFAEGSSPMQLVSTPQAGLSTPYNNVVYLTFCIGSYWCGRCSETLLLAAHSP